MLVNLYRAISPPVRRRVDNVPDTSNVSSIEAANRLQSGFDSEEIEGKLPVDIVTLSDAAKQYRLDKKALDSALGGLLHSKRKNIYELSVVNEDEGLSVIEKQIERIKEELERLKLELSAISGDNSESAKLERKIIQELMMLLTVEMMGLLERKINQVK